MGKSKYRFCRMCGQEFHGKDRERHIKGCHEERMDIRFPKQWFLEKPPTGKEMMKPQTDEMRKHIHDSFVEELANMFLREGYKVIIEGKIPEKWFPYLGHWREPDLFVIKDSKLVKVIEVVVADPYENGKAGVTVYNKCKTIKEYYNPPELIVFEPTEYLDKEYLPERKSHYRKILGVEPTSYKQLQKYYAKKWQKEGLNVVFWNEQSLQHASRV